MSEHVWPTKPEAPFLEVPDAISIAHYFMEETGRRNLGCDGIDLYREGRDYCYLWVEAMVDLDMWEAYLLDIRTHIAVPPGEMGETRDFLFVFVGAGNRFDVEWYNHPRTLSVRSQGDPWERWQAAMKWFTGLVEKSVEDAEEANRG